MKPRLLVVLVPAALVALALYMRGMAAHAMQTFTAYQTPFAFAAESAPQAPPLAQHVVLVLMDGLGYGPSKEMAFLNTLRARGADYDCRIGLPSLSLPGRAVMATGAWQEVNGQATNYNPRRVRIEHLFQVAHRQGLRTFLGANEGAFKLFDPWIDDRLLFEETPEEAPFSTYEAHLEDMSQKERAMLHDRRPRLAMVEYHITDEAGHGWGSSSPEYHRAVALTDQAIQQLVAEIDLTTTAIAITADHGHVPVGGHGGNEPEVMHVPLVLAGAGVRPGVHGEARQTDIASTLALLLGIPVPASNQGHPLLDALAFDEAGRLAALRTVAAQRASFVRRYVAWTSGAVPAAPESPAGVKDAGWYESRLVEMDALAAHAKDARLAIESSVRSRLSLTLALLPLLVVGVLLAARAISASELGRASLAALAGQAVYYALLPLVGIAYSFSAVNKDEWLNRFFMKDMAVAVVAAAVAVILAAWAKSRRRPETLDVAALSWLASGVFAYVFVLKIAAVYWRHGVFLDWSMPDQYWGFGFYLDALAVMAVGFATPLLPLVALFTGWLRAPRPAGAGDARAA